ERLLHDDPSVRRAARLREPGDDGGEHARRNREVVARPRRPRELLLETHERRGVVVVAVHVAELLGEAGRGPVGRAPPPRARPPVPRNARLRPLHELVPRPAGLGDAHDREVEASASGHRLEGGEDLLVGEVARCSEEAEGVGAGLALHFFSTCPPKPKRMAERTLFWKRSCPREANRAKRAAVGTLAGTPSS